MIRTILLILLQSFLLVSSQVSLKFALRKLPSFSWSWAFFKAVICSWPLLIAGVCGTAAFVVWIMLLKKNDFSLVYPLTAVSYVIGLCLSFFILHETIPFTRWIGVLILMVGVYFIIK